MDPLSKSYPELTPYQFASNSCIAGIDLDGLEFFFAAGAGNDGKSGSGSGSDYVDKFRVSLKNNGIDNFKQLNSVHSASLIPLIGISNDSHHALYSQFNDQPYWNVPTHKEIVTEWTTGRGGRYPTKFKTVTTYEISDQAKHAAREILNSRQPSQQLNLAGYSFGSVVVAQTALYLIKEKKMKIDNLVLIGSPISQESELYKVLLKYQNEGKIGKIHYINTLGDSVAGVGSKSTNEKNKVWDQLFAKIINGTINDDPHIKFADKDDNSERNRTAEQLKSNGVK